MKRQVKLLSISIMIIMLSFSFVKISDNNFEMIKNLDIYYTLFQELNRYYVDDIKPGGLVKTSIDAALKSLDPYTNYIPESNIEDIRFMTTGQYGGIGAIVQTRSDKVVIIEPYESSPAIEAGLKAGDIILKINNNDVKGKTADQISDALKGQPNTNIDLLIKRPGVDESFSVEVIRKKIQIDNVPYFGMIDDKIGYIKLTNFTDKAAAEVKHALTELKTKHAISGLVLDLRGNPGGLLMQAVQIVNLFVPKNTLIVNTRGKFHEGNNKFYTISEPVDTNIPLAVIVNRGSASASEIVAGAIQDLDRGVIIGQRTFGKGLVQRTVKLSYNSQLKVTIAKYYIPSGRCIQALDYTHRNPDGSVGKVPDSLITEFSTKSGRKVYDGGGIKPDIEIKEQSLGQIAYSLYSGNFLFDYATKYVIKKDTISAPEEFEINEKEYADFIEYTKSNNFKYYSKTEKQLKNLIETAKAEKYYKIADKELNKLEEILVENKDKDFELFKNEISKLLNEEIISRFYYQKGRIRYALTVDKEAEKAKEILYDLSKYQTILKPQ